jgi:SsrA-binding protein
LSPKEKRGTSKSEIKVVCQNRKAHHEYFLDDFMEAGMVLLGPEVKSLREGRASLVDAYAKVKKGEIYVHGLNITPYPHSHHMELDPLRIRKLLMRRAEIRRLIGKTEEKGYTLIPTKVYFKKGLAKVELALARGKKKYDKRQTLKERELKKDLDQARKNQRY